MNTRLVAIWVSDVTVGEDTGSARVSVRLSRTVAETVTVKVYTRADTAIGGTDYYGFTRLLTFAPGETSQTVSITIVDDAIAESNESFSLRLFDAINANIGDNAGLIQINDND